MSGHAHSTASTRVRRRRENFGSANTVRRTELRGFADIGHRAPRNHRDRFDNTWRGTSNPARRRSTRRRPSWRDWYRESFLAMWRDRSGS